MMLVLPELLAPAKIVRGRTSIECSPASDLKSRTKIRVMPSGPFGVPLPSALWFFARLAMEATVSTARKSPHAIIRDRARQRTRPVGEGLPSADGPLNETVSDPQQDQVPNSTRLWASCDC